MNYKIQAICSFFLFFLLTPTILYAYSIESTRELYNDFPDDHFLITIDKSSADFDFYAYFKYMSAGMCKQANKYIENIKNKDTEYYNIAKGISYGNGDCEKIDFNKSQHLLLKCFSSDYDCISSLANLYIKFDIINDKTLNLVGYTALHGSRESIAYIIDFYMSHVDKKYEGVALMWMYISMRGLKNDNVLFHMLQSGIKNIESKIGEKKYTAIKKIALELSDKIIENIKIRKFKSKNRLYKTLYYLTPVTSLKIQNSSKNKKIYINKITNLDYEKIIKSQLESNIKTILALE